MSNENEKTALHGPCPGGSQPNNPSGGQPSGETIALRVWGAKEDQALLKDLVEKFKAAHPAFMNVADGDSSNQMKSGALAAMLSGCWDSQVAAEVWGEGYMACRLPSFTAGGQKVPGGAVLLAEFLCNEESQMALYIARQLPPTNIAASADPAVAADKGVAGLADQSVNASLQFAGGKYWDPAKSFGEQIAQGTIKNDDASVQAALDDLVAGVTAPLG